MSYIWARYVLIVITCVALAWGLVSMDGSVTSPGALAFALGPFIVAAGLTVLYEISARFSSLSDLLALGPSSQWRNAPFWIGVAATALVAFYVTQTGGTSTITLLVLVPLLLAAWLSAAAHRWYAFPLILVATPILYYWTYVSGVWIRSEVINPPWIALFVFGIAWLVGTTRLRRDQLKIPLLVFLYALWTSLLAASNQSPPWEWIAFHLMNAPVLVFILLQQPVSLRSIKYTTVAAVVATLLSGAFTSYLILQRVGYLPLSLRDLPPFVFDTPAGMTINHMASVYMVALILAIATFGLAQARVFKALLAGSAGLLSVLLFMTRSLDHLFTTLIALALYGLYKVTKSLKVTLLAFAIVFSLGVFITIMGPGFIGHSSQYLPDRYSHLIEIRLLSWRVGWETILNDPIAGDRYKNLSLEDLPAIISRAPHLGRLAITDAASLYLAIAAHTGLPGFLLYFSLVPLTIKAALTAAGKAKGTPSEGLIVGLLISFFAVLLVGFTDGLPFYHVNLMYTLVLWVPIAALLKAPEWAASPSPSKVLVNPPASSSSSLPSRQF